MSMSSVVRNYNAIATPSFTLSAAPGANFTPNIALSFSASTSQTSPYALVFPAALPSTANQALLSDTNGNMSWGTVASSGGSGGGGATSLAGYGTFSAAAPQATPADVVGLVGSNTLTALNLIVAINATVKIYAVYAIQLYQKGSATNWGITYSSITDSDDVDAGIVFTVTSTGQVQYTSPSYSGWVSTSMNWYASYTVASTATSQITNTFSGGSNITTPTSIPGLSLPTGTNQYSVTVFVAVRATNRLSALVTLMVYPNATATGYLINTTNSGDNIGINWTVNTAGQILYTSTTYTGFVSMQMSWTTPFVVATTATSIPSLVLTSSLSVGTNTLLAQSPLSGSVSSLVGSLVHVAGATFTDTSTAASSTATGTFNGTYLAAPILAATNTAVTNTLASTLTIGGAPTAGANITLSNAYALNVLSGIAQFGGPLLANGPITAKTIAGLSLALANATSSGVLTASNIGTFLNIQAQTYTDTGTAASSTATGAFSASYLGIPTLAASNTAVTTATASTLTIAGAPVAGSNEAITNAYALNVLSGNSLFGGTVSVNTINSSPSGLFLTGTGGIVDSGLISIQYTAPSISGMTANVNYYPVWTYSIATSKFPSTIVPGNLVDGSGKINIPGSGFWRIVVDFYWQNVSSATGNGAFAVYFLGTKAVGGTPTASGYLAMQLVYEQYFTGATTIAAGNTALNYGGGSITSLVMNVSRISR